MSIIRAFLPLILFTAVIGVVCWLLLTAFVTGVNSWW
jgi:hypothetical protein